MDAKRKQTYVLLIGLVLIWLLATIQGGTGPGLLFTIALVAYLIPALIAWRRGHPQHNAIAALNVLLGWTLLGWAGALVWSLMAIERSESRPGAA